MLMKSSTIFFSLKWRISLLTAFIFLLLHSVFTYLIYLDTKNKFVNDRDIVVSQFQNVAHALSKDSFLILDQFAELFSVSESHSNTQQPTQHIFSTLNNNWQQWQFIWGLENAKFFDTAGNIIRQWGKPLDYDMARTHDVLKNETPNHHIICDVDCYQTVTIPMMVNSEVIGAFSVSRSFVDTVIEYNRVTHSDIAVIVHAKTGDANSWPYKITALTNATKNEAIFKHISENFKFEDLLLHRSVIELDAQSYEVNIFPIMAQQTDNQGPYFLVLNDISPLRQTFNNTLQTIWVYGLISFLVSLAITLISLLIALRRVINLSSAFPLLADKRYVDFRNQIRIRHPPPRLIDELDTLNLSAMDLSDQLEALENTVDNYIQKIIQKGEELIQERDFVHQLIHVAPILILTQDKHGTILSINQAGMDEFMFDEEMIVGNQFDSFIPNSEQQHINLLQQIRKGETVSSVKYDGYLAINPAQKKHISWIHSPLKPHVDNTAIVLTLGVDISDRKQIEEQMLNLATHDHLTGLNNRRKFQTELKREFATAQRNGQIVGLMYIDLDRFKAVNDSCGHHAGDKLLLQVAQQLQLVIRETDILSRIGGDEFTLIMPNTNISGIINVAEKINHAINAIEFSSHDKTFRIGASIGIALYPDHGKDVQQLLANADTAMYYAKHHFPGKYHVFTNPNPQ